MNVQESCLGGFLATHLFLVMSNSDCRLTSRNLVSTGLDILVPIALSFCHLLGGGALDLVALTLYGLLLITIELVGSLEGSDNVKGIFNVVTGKYWLHGLSSCGKSDVAVAGMVSWLA